ncbi:MAG: vimentin [Anaerosporomusa subterranea]|nr:vimentin [Anaerosporomusa subterranea]
MSETIIDSTRQEVIRLLHEQRGMLEQLLSTPNLLKSQQDHQQRSLNREDIGQWLEILNGEIYKAERLEVTFAVVGTMKAGKSTTINAIVGTEVLPNRNQPMTTLPTVIRHRLGQKEPILTFPNPRPFNEIIEKLRDDLEAKRQAGQLAEAAFSATDDGRELIESILDGSLTQVRDTYHGYEEIYQFLKCINDIWRLCSSDCINIDMDMYLDEYDEIHEFPAIEVEFFHLRDQTDPNQGRFTLIDTPGPNEAGQTYLKHIMQEQLEKASAVLAVLDYTQLSAEADAEVREALDEIANLTDNRLFILVNKFDQKDRHGMDVDVLRSYVVKNLFEGRLERDRVHPVSSKYGYLANRALSELAFSGALPDYKANPWVEDFGRIALGACWESEIEDPEEVQYRAAKLWRNSLFDKPLTEVIKKGSENAALISLRSAVAKMDEFDRRVVEGLQLKQKAINIDIKVLEEHIKSLEEDIRLIKVARDDARSIIDESILLLQMEINDLFAGCDSIVKKEVQAIFSGGQSRNWVKQRLQGFIDHTPTTAKPLAVNFDPDGSNDFQTEAEAKQFLNRLIEAVHKHIEPVLNEMQVKTQQTVDDMSIDIWAGVNRRLQKILSAAEQRLNDSFSVSLEFPKPKVRPVAIDFAELRQGVVKEDTVSKTATRQERKWYTLWCRKHDVAYQYEEQIYRIYTREIAGQLQALLEDDHRRVRTALDSYVQNEFSKAIHTYFMEMANYLERFKGDLIDSKHDQELEGDRLAKLQTAMEELHRLTFRHRNDVRAAENELPNGGEQSPHLHCIKTA